MAGGEFQYLRHNLGSLISCVDALPQLPISTNQADFPNSGPFFDLPAHCRNLHAHYAGDPSRSTGLDTFRIDLGFGNCRNHLQNVSLGKAADFVFRVLYRHGLDGGHRLETRTGHDANGNVDSIGDRRCFVHCGDDFLCHAMYAISTRSVASIRLGWQYHPFSRHIAFFVTRLARISHQTDQQYPYRSCFQCAET